MGNLQKLLESTLEKNLTAEFLVGRLIKVKCNAMGIVLTKDQCVEISNKLSKGQLENFTIRIDDTQLLNAKLEIVNGQPRDIEISINDDAAIDSLIGSLVSEIIAVTQTDIADMLWRSLKSSFPKSLAAQRKDRRKFERNLRKNWSKAFDLLDAFIGIVLETGTEFNDEFRPDAAKTNDVVFEVQVRLHARACQVASEVCTLLKSGFPDGAHARWRTLHEITAVAMFIGQHGIEVALRYLDHDVVQSYKAAQEQQRHHKTLGLEPIRDQDLAELKAAKDTLKDKYGRCFDKRFGWASQVLGKEAPDFADIERDAGLEHMRPYYTLASHNVHANTKGIFFKLGASPFAPNLLLAGASVWGLAEPGQGTVTALLQITTSVLLSRPNLDNLVACRILQRVADEVIDTFVDIQTRLENSATTSLVD